MKGPGPDLEHRYRLLVENVKDYAIFMMDVDGRVSSWNEGAQRILGYSEGDILGSPADVVFTPEDRARGVPQEEMRTAAREGRASDERWHLRKDGSRFFASGVLTAVRGGAGDLVGFAKLMRDVTPQKLAENRLRTEHAVSRVLAEALTFGEAMPAVLEAVCTTLDWDWGGLWTVDEHHGVLRWAGAWKAPSLDAPEFEAASRGTTLACGVGLPGRVWESGQPAWVTDVGADANFPRKPAALRAGLRGAICFPVSSAGNLLGVMEFFSREVRPPDESLLEMMRVVGRQVGQFLARRRAEEALRGSEARNAAVLEAALDCIVSMDHRGRVIEWNPAAERAFGYGRDEAVGREMAELIIPPAYRERHRLGLAKYLASGEGPVIGRRFEITALRKGGGEFPVELTITRLPSDGPPTFTGFLRDVTDRKRGEEELRDREERLKLAIAIAQMGTFEIDLRTDAVTVNEPGRAIYGWAAGEPLTFTRVQSHFHPDDREEVMRRVAAALDPAGPGHFEVEQRIFHTGGATRWIRVRGRADFEGDGAARKAVRCIGTYIDITGPKEAEQQRERLLRAEQSARAEAERAGRVKDEFLATLSHELRTPLNAILGWSQLLRGARTDAEDLRQGLETIERNARAQTQIIEDLLDMSRIISGKVRLDVQRIDLAPVVRSAVETVRPAADAKGVRLQAVLDPLARPVSGDPNRLQQVFWNLLTNAVKFTPRGGRVQVLLERINSHLEVSVVDTGEGIAPEFLPHVFERFRQGDASSSRRHGGLGLGLSIVKQLVELHGGTVRASSGGPGRGSTFTVSLPLTIIHPDPAPAAERRHPGAPAGAAASLDDCPRLAGLKVLVVDDEADARALVRRLLQDCDAVVQTAASAPEAMELIQSHPPDVLVSDIGMPGEDGYSLIRRVRALAPDRGGTVPALALTAYARSEDRIRAIQAGYQMHVAKPVEPAELIIMVAGLAGRAAPKS